MKEQVLQNLSAVLRALNTVTVSGKENLANLGGSINMLEQIFSALSNADFKEHEERDMPAPRPDRAERGERSERHERPERRRERTADEGVIED